MFQRRHLTATIIHKFSLTLLNMTSFKARESSYTRGCKMKFSSTGEKRQKSQEATVCLLLSLSLYRANMCDILVLCNLSIYLIYYFSSLIVIMSRLKFNKPTFIIFGIVHYNYRDIGLRN